MLNQIAAMFHWKANERKKRVSFHSVGNERVHVIWWDQIWPLLESSRGESGKELEPASSALPKWPDFSINRAAFSLHSARNQLVGLWKCNSSNKRNYFNSGHEFISVQTLTWIKPNSKSSVMKLRWTGTHYYRAVIRVQCVATVCVVHLKLYWVQILLID